LIICERVEVGSEEKMGRAGKGREGELLIYLREGWTRRGHDQMGNRIDRRDEVKRQPLFSQFASLPGFKILCH
jgi:hypothetical protein